MTLFTEPEIAYLTSERRLARLATIGSDGMPHVTPVGWRINSELETIDVRGHSLDKTKKFRDVLRSGRAAIVIDDLLPPWQPRGIEVRGEAEAIAADEGLIRIHPRRILSWGIETTEPGSRSARDVPT